MRHTLISLDPVRDAKLWAGIDRARRQLRRTAGNGELAWDQLQVEAVINAVSRRRRRRTGRGARRARSITTRSSTGCMPTRCVSSPTDNHSRCRRSASWRVRPRSSRSCSTATDARSTSDAPHGWQHPLNATPYERCTKPACTRPAACPSTTVGSTTSSPGNTAARQTSTISAHSANQPNTISWCTKADGDLTMTPDRIATWTRPDGTMFHTGTTIDRAPNGITPEQVEHELQPC